MSNHDDYCESRATEQFAWCDIRDGVMRFSVPYCTKHSEECQPAESTEVYDLPEEDEFIGCQWAGEDSFSPHAARHEWRY